MGNHAWFSCAARVCAIPWGRLFEAYRYLAAQKLKELRASEKALSHLKGD